MCISKLRSNMNICSVAQVWSCHTVNEHSFSSYTLFPQCVHAPIKSMRPWISALSIAFSKLRSVICGKDDKNLKDLKHYTDCLQTSDIESFNALILKYANKTFFYSWISMFMRPCVAAIDWNSTTAYLRRQTAKTISRYGNRSIAPVKVDEDYS